MDTVGSDESFARAPAAGPGGARVRRGRRRPACDRASGFRYGIERVHIRGPGRTRNAHNSHIFLTQEEEPGAPEWNRNSPIRTATASDVQGHSSHVVVELEGVKDLGRTAGHHHQAHSSLDREDFAPSGRAALSCARRQGAAARSSSRPRAVQRPSRMLP